MNKNVEREIHPIPTFEKATDEMDGATVWSKLDLYKRFHQLPLHPHSLKYATFSTPRGLRRCTTVVMGFTNASEILQRTMNMVLSGLPGVKWIHDDITVYGRTMREHNERLIACLDRLKEFNVRLNKEKCVFGASTVNFMAMRLSVKGIQPSTQKVEAVKSFKTPETVSDVKSFLGIVNFLSVKFGCQFDHYLSGDPGFAVTTDHKPLLGLYRPGSRPPPRIERWALRIQHLNFHMRYEPGAQNAADVLSRHDEPSTQASWRILGLSMPSYRLHYLGLVLWTRSAQLQPVIQSCKLLSKALRQVVGPTLSLPLTTPTA